MKIQVNIRTVGFISVQAKLEVIDQGDFPTTKIFQNIGDYPTDMHYKLFPGKTSIIYHSLKSSETANDWVDAQISALEKHLKSWRTELYSKDYEVEI